jgi:ATP-dependent DNA ligase
MTTFIEYIQQKRATKKKIPAEIIERWQNRIVARNLHTQGEAGARQYLADYGRGIAAPKVILLALQAEAQGATEMALGFWKKAYTLETGKVPDDGATLPTPTSATPQLTPKAFLAPAAEVAGLPPHLQPGAVMTMQPIDAQLDRAAYINNPAYWGQPKRDGNRLVIIAGPNGIFYQSRSTKLREAPDIRIDATLKQAVQEHGVFVLDGELYYTDAHGGEHRTGAQAATANIQLDEGDIMPQARYGIFKALFFNEEDLTPEPEAERINAGELLGNWLEKHAPGFFEIVPTARTEDEKRALVTRQQVEGREGEVWVRTDVPYKGGKDSRGVIVRTKYLKEMEVIILRLTPTTAEDRPFGAIEVGAYHEGSLISLGAVGTGYTLEQMREIATRHAATPGQIVITVACQGFTETGQLWHGRFVDFNDLVAPEDCLCDNSRAPAASSPITQAAIPAQLELF